MNRPTLNDRPNPADRTKAGGERASKDVQKRSSGDAAQDNGGTQDAGDSDKSLKGRFRWVPRLLVLLVVACLLFAAWVWFQIFRILILI